MQIMKLKIKILSSNGKSTGIKNILEVDINKGSSTLHFIGNITYGID